MDPKEEYERFMRSFGILRRIQANHLRAQIAHEDAQDELTRMTSAFTQRDANHLLAECLSRRKS
jgi:hypothetical protein